MPVHPNSLENLKLGKKFSKTYKPKNTGRRKSYLKEFIDTERISLDDLKIILENLIMDHSFGDLEKILARGQKTLPAAIAGYIKAISADLKKGKLDALNSALDRVYGMPTRTNVVEVYDITDDAKKKMQSIFDNMLAIETKPADILEQQDMKPDSDENEG